MRNTVPRTRAEGLQELSPQLVADVTFYLTSEGGKKLTAQPGGDGCVAARNPTTL